jgi:hypothetical protein
VTARFGIVTGRFGHRDRRAFRAIVTGRFGIVTDRFGDRDRRIRTA